jgi:hypothetical protein
MAKRRRKVIIVLTDAPPHPDGDCCNAEGDTLEGTIFGLTGEGARAYVIGPENAALKRIAGRHGRPVLQDPVGNEPQAHPEGDYWGDELQLQDRD